MIKKYITFALLDKDYKYINNLKKDLYFITNNPSFNIFPSLSILGETNLSNFKNNNLKINNPIIEFESNLTFKKESVFIKSKNNSLISYLKNELCVETLSNTFSKYLKLPKNEDNYPIIYLGTNSEIISTNIKKIFIKDIRLNIVEIILNNNEIKYKTLDSIHLSMDKILLENSLYN